MFKAALKELKFHPARYLATIVAIAISVGFVAASSMVTSTEGTASARQLSAPYARADLVMTLTPASTVTTTQAEVREAVLTTPGVDTGEPLINQTLLLSKGNLVGLASVTVLPSSQFLWTELREGTWPASGEIALNSALAKALEVGIGDQIDHDDTSLTVSGITTEPVSTFIGTNTAIIGPDESPTDEWVHFGNWVLTLNDTVSITQVISDLEAAIGALGLPVEVVAGEDYVKEVARSVTGDIDTFKYLLWIFAAIAVVVGLITISNTFTILLAQRQRHIGLLRSIGTSGKQIRRSVWVEALFLGLIGGLIGVGLACGLTAVLGIFTGSIHYGIHVPLVETALALGLGMVITLVASIVPARRSSKVPPLQALQPVAMGVHVKRVSIVRTVICGLMIAAGFAGALYSVTITDNALLVAVLSSGVLAVGVLFGARLFVPSLLRAVGFLVRGLGPEGSAAAKNVIRDPARASATATALMLAVGLIITLQIGAASMSISVQNKVAEEYPIDLFVSSRMDGDGRLDLPAAMSRSLNEISGIGRVLSIACKDQESVAEGETSSFDRVCSYTPELAAFAPRLPQAVPDDQIFIWESGWGLTEGATVELNAGGIPMKVTTKFEPIVMDSYSFVSPKVYATLAGESYDNALIFMKVSEESNLMPVVQAVEEVVGEHLRFAQLDGSIFQKTMIEQAMDIVVSIVSALLAVAVLIALVGVGNTLTLSVIERQRENAIFRALGFLKRQLKIMLLIEAALLTLIGGVVGLVFGGFFGWIGAKAAAAQFVTDGVVLPVTFAIDWPMTLGLLGVLLVASILASLLPGRRAAKASPVEALAEI
jgi:putative ABC transport system permease protein